MSSLTLTDQWGRAVDLIIADDGSCTYTHDGMTISVPERDDMRALDQISMHNAPQTDQPTEGQDT